MSAAGDPSIADAAVDGGAISEDAMLGGRVRLVQPRHGFRAAIDAVFLAAAVPARPGERILDAGSGSGAAALCLAARLPGAALTGIEADAGLVGLAKRGAAASGLAERVQFHAGDLGAPPAPIKEAAFDHVMTNPPFNPVGRGRAPGDAAKARATQEDMGLAAWIDACIGLAGATGGITLIHRADRLDEMLAATGGRLGGISVFPLWPGPDDGGEPRPAKRIVVHGRRGSAAPMRLLPGMVLHGADGAYTAAAEAVLRHARGLDLAAP